MLERITVLDIDAFTTGSLAPRTTGWGIYKLGQCLTPAIIPISYRPCTNTMIFNIHIFLIFGIFLKKSYSLDLPGIFTDEF